jgi:hypothetical protein
MIGGEMTAQIAKLHDVIRFRRIVVCCTIISNALLMGKTLAADCQLSTDAAMSVSCGFAKPEDVQFIPSRSLVIVSEQGWKSPESGGAISSVAVDKRHGASPIRRQLWPPPTAAVPIEPKHQRNSHVRVVGDAKCSSPPAVDAFSPHGIAALESSNSTIVRVAVVGHGAREAIELFDLIGSGDTARLQWRGCVPLPPNTAGNDVAIHPDGRLFVTNYIPSVHDFRALLSMKKGARGEITGDVLEWSPANGWRHLPRTEMSIPNGIVLRSNRARSKETVLYVAESGKWRVVEFALASNGDITRKAEVAVDGSPDDLNWSLRGTLLAPTSKPGDAPEWHLEEINISTHTAYRVSDGTDAIHSVTSATDIGVGIVFGSMTDDRIALYKRSSAAEK